MYAALACKECKGGLAVGNVEQGIVGVVIMPFVVVVFAFPDMDFVVHSKEGNHAVITAF